MPTVTSRVPTLVKQRWKHTPAAGTHPTWRARHGVSGTGGGTRAHDGRTARCAPQSYARAVGVLSPRGPTARMSKRRKRKRKR
jgi:hypothetical protein